MSWPCWLTDSGCFTHNVVTQPAVSLVQYRESSPARTGGLTTMLCHQLMHHVFHQCCPSYLCSLVWSALLQLIQDEADWSSHHLAVTISVWLKLHWNTVHFLLLSRLSGTVCWLNEIWLIHTHCSTDDSRHICSNLLLTDPTDYLMHYCSIHLIV